MRIAIIDMGTNTFNLLIVETLVNNKYEIIFRDKAGVKLGKGGINNKIITPEAFERGMTAIEKHMNTIRSFNAEKTIATATSGVRSTENGKEFVQSIESKFGLKVQIISGNEEAELIYRGVKQAVTFNNENVLILDIGGGSNEFIIANHNGIIWKHSFKLGMARLLDKFNPSDPITFEEIKKVEKHIHSKLGILYDAISELKPEKLVGCSGTFDSFRAMIIAKNGGIPDDVRRSVSYPINIVDYEKLHVDLINSTLEDRKKMEGLELVRVEMIVLASIFVNFIIRKFKIKSLTQSTFAIKEGMVDKILNS
ncbi:MAG: phosphatase [Marinilabiliales bacterium]|nr:MAG: phosphatase [Marinilabiliales bacterium]